MPINLHLTSGENKALDEFLDLASGSDDSENVWGDGILPQLEKHKAKFDYKTSTIEQVEESLKKAQSFKPKKRKW